MQISRARADARRCRSMSAAATRARRNDAHLSFTQRRARLFPRTPSVISKPGPCGTSVCMNSPSPAGKRCSATARARHPVAICALVRDPCGATSASARPDGRQCHPLISRRRTFPRLDHHFRDFRRDTGTCVDDNRLRRPGPAAAGVATMSSLLFTRTKITRPAAPQSYVRCFPWIQAQGRGKTLADRVCAAPRLGAQATISTSRAIFSDLARTAAPGAERRFARTHARTISSRRGRSSAHRPRIARALS